MDESKKKYMTGAVRRYRSLFTFPDYWLLLALTPIVNVFGSICAFEVTTPSLSGIYDGVLFGLQVLTVPTIVLDLVSARLVTRKDTIFNLRRTAALSMVLCGFWSVFLIIGSLLQRWTGSANRLSEALIFGACVVISFRALVLISVTKMSSWRAVLFMAMQPVSCLVSGLAFWSLWKPAIPLAVLASTAVLLAAVFSFLYLVNRHGKVEIGIGVIPLFRGFIASWMADLAPPLEGYFEELGSTEDISVSLLKFEGSENAKAVMVVPGIHPGPFRNLGSSNLPYMVQSRFEEEFGVKAIVPHGASGHELDLTSQLQCERVLKETISLNGFTPADSIATRLARAEVGLGKATCQIFGGVALVTVTCAPRSMEDVPREIGLEIEQMGLNLGAKAVIVIDAHNSIGSPDEVPVLSDEELADLKLSAHDALVQALKLEREPFSIGVSKVAPGDFNVAQGIGLAGIVVLVVAVGGQRVAYVTIDGNNMIRGLREDIRNSLKDLVEDCEVLTTDTHVVNAVSSINRGYYPIGEVADRGKLISYIRQAVSQAVANVQASSASYRLVCIHGVKIIGEEKLLDLTKLVDSTFKYMAKIAPLIFIPAVTLSLLPFVLLLG